MKKFRIRWKLTDSHVFRTRMPENKFFPGGWFFMQRDCWKTGKSYGIFFSRLEFFVLCVQHTEKERLAVLSNGLLKYNLQFFLLKGLKFCWQQKNSWVVYQHSVCYHRKSIRRGNWPRRVSNLIRVLYIGWIKSLFVKYLVYCSIALPP